MTDTLDDIVLDDLPAEIWRAIAARERLREEVRVADPGFEFVVSDVDGWGAGATVRVAFMGGNDALLGDIEETLREIEAVCGVRFNLRDAQGGFLRWSTTDTEYAGDIRVSFDKSGYWSLVGRDSVDSAISSGTGVGGGPHERSLNLSGFDHSRPPTWHGTVLHEFLHALAFHHEHQNLGGPCQDDFRWDDDAGYVLTTGPTGSYSRDMVGRRPGIYTYLSGPPNRWERAKVDHNLKADPSGKLRYGPFDRGSVMLYRFDALFYMSAQSSCRPDGDGQHLSQGDITALKELYPVGEPEVAAVDERKAGLIKLIEQNKEVAVDGGLEAVAVEPDWIDRIKRSMSRRR